MKKIIWLGAFISAHVFAHQPYVAPLSYTTENSQIPVISGYAENALSSEFALKKSQFTIISPSQKSILIEPDSNFKSATVFDLPLPETGTYQISSTLSFPLKYAQHNKQWKILHEVSAEKAGPIEKRDYLIPSDFKKLKIEEITREWSIQSYVSKNASSALSKQISAPLNVRFSSHPNEIIAATTTQILVSKNKKALKNAQISIIAKGTDKDQAITVTTNADGVAEVKFPTAGEYLVEVTEQYDPKKQPVNQYYTLISLEVHA